MPSTRRLYPHYGITDRQRSRAAVLPKRRRVSTARRLAAALVGVIAFLAALYVGIDVMLVGGVLGAIHAAQAQPVDTSGVVWNIVRAVFSGTAAWLVCVAGFALAALVAD